MVPCLSRGLGAAPRGYSAETSSSVISGILITKMIIEDIDDNQFSFEQFYSGARDAAP